MSKISHYQPAFLDTMRQQTDPLAEQAVEALYRSANFIKLREVLACLHRNGDPLPDGLPDEIYSFFEISGQLPSWADEKRMQQGAAFFSRYAGDLMMMLGLLSLPYDYASARGVQVLYLSARLHDNPGKRLLETGRYILDVTASHAFSKRGNAILSAQKVRLMHAAIRYHIRQSGEWNFEELGQPINQEDMAATNLSVSLMSVRGLRKLNLKVAHEDMQAYIHLWNVASYVMGVDESLLPGTAKEAYVLNKMIATRQQAPSVAGRCLTKSLLHFIRQQVQSGPGPGAAVYMRYLLGEQIADYLAVPPYQMAEELVIRTIRRLNHMRNIIPDSQSAYYQVRTRLNRQAKSLRTPDAGSHNFKIPHSLTS